MTQLGLMEEGSQARGGPPATQEPSRGSESNRPLALGRSRRSVVTPMDSDSLRGQLHKDAEK